MANRGNGQHAEVTGTATTSYLWSAYQGQCCTKAGFNVVTGNMDIPLRARVGLSGSFFDERLTLGVSANYNFAYDGVADTGDTEDVDGIQREIWDDKAFDASLTECRLLYWRARR